MSDERTNRDPRPTDDDAANNSLPEIDEGPSPEPVDEIQAVLFAAAQAGAKTDLEFEELITRQLPNIEPADADEVKRALAEAARTGLPTEVDFDHLPAPTKPLEPVKPAPAPDTPPPAAAVKPPAPKPQPPPKVPPKPAPIFAAPADFSLILALFVVFRVLALFLLRPGGFIRDWSDFDTYFGIAALSDYGLHPFFNFWLEWPPLIPWLAVGAYRLSLLLPPWSDDPRLWFVLLMGGVFLLFEVGNFFLLSRLARRLYPNPETTGRVLWLYALLFAPIYSMLGFFDGVALFFMLLALDWLLAENRSLSAVAVGVGIVVKIIPVITLPIAARRLWYQHQKDNREAAIEVGLYAVICGLAVFVLLAPFLFWGSEWVLASFRSMAGRSSWETVWALLEGYYGFGVVLGDRLNPAETGFAAHQSWLPWWGITAAFALGYLLLFLRQADYSQSRNVLAFGGLTVSLFLLYNKGYSPQFLVYLLPFMVLLMPNARGVIYALVLTGLNVLEQPVYFVLLPHETWLLVVVVLARTLLLALLALEFGLILWPLKESAGGLANAHRYLPRTVAGLALLILLVLLPVSVRALNNEQLTHTPVGIMTSLLDLHAESPKSRLLLSDQATYRQLYPYLQNKFDMRLTDGQQKGYSATLTIPQLLDGQQRVWILPTGPQGKRLQTAVESRGTELTSYTINGLGTASLYSFEPNPLPIIPPARFIGGIELLTHHVNIQSDAVTVDLYWRARQPQNQNLTVFTQLINSDGELVTSHDSVPNNGAAPVTGWEPGVVQLDRHRIELPPSFPPGDYTLLVGLYNNSNERVGGIDPQGVGFANRAVPLEVLRFQ
ncbi:MAG: hypothetical protein FOGNACKC_04756 [Anaerolineae bacterium]|nr:hypothetical protein [Anaerolineae bacterium]